MNPTFWRRWHRWVAFPATLFLLFASVTGCILAWTEFFGPAEAEREATRKLVSPVTLGGVTEPWAHKLADAFAAAAAKAGNAPVDKVTVQFKGTKPSITIYTGKPSGGEDKQFVVDARTGALLSETSYEDKPFLNRLHSGEALGDGGLVFAMFWDAALAFLTLTGILIYFLMWRPNLRGIKRFFW
jgi:uncharacterized iron-regulated membrane protein